MKDFFRRSTVTKACDFLKPHLYRLASEVIADIAAQLREKAAR